MGQNQNTNLSDYRARTWYDTKSNTRPNLVSFAYEYTTLERTNKVRSHQKRSYDYIISIFNIITLDLKVKILIYTLY